MEVRVQDKKATLLSGIKPVIAEIGERLQSQPNVWLRKLRDDPGSFADLEKSVHHAFRQMADQVVAGLLAQATGDADFAQSAKKK